MGELKERVSETVKEKVYESEVSPGLKTYILPRRNFSKKFAVFSTRFGSIDSSFEVDGHRLDVPDGVAHFLEHKLFESENDNAFDRFAELGASSNAFTSFTQTSYLFSCTENFEDSLELLLNFVQEPYFSEETVEKEKGIIEQEIRMYEDHPQWRIFFSMLESLYQYHPVRKDIAGTVDSIHRITPEILYQCYRTFYHPCNMALFVVGDVSAEEVLTQVKNNLGSREFPEWKGIKRIYPQEPPQVNRRRVEHSMVVSEPILGIGFKDVLPGFLEGEALLRREIVTELLLEIIFGNSEPLFNHLYEEGLIDEGFDAGYTVETNHAYTFLGGETRDAELLYQKIMEGIRGLKEKGITFEQLERHRRKILGEFMRRFNSLEFVANNFLSYRFKNADFFAFPRLLQEITLQEINERLEEHLDPDLHAVSVILPGRE